MLRQTALRLISVIGYSLSLSSLTLATLLMAMLRSVVEGFLTFMQTKCTFCWRKRTDNAVSLNIVLFGELCPSFLLIRMNYNYNNLLIEMMANVRK